jgi:hypothetical protein
MNQQWETNYMTTPTRASHDQLAKEAAEWTKEARLGKLGLSDVCKRYLELYHRLCRTDDWNGEAADIIRDEMDEPYYSMTEEEIKYSNHYINKDQCEKYGHVVDGVEDGIGCHNCGSKKPFDFGDKEPDNE